MRTTLEWYEGEIAKRDVRQYAADIDSGDVHRDIDARQCTVERNYFFR